MDVLVTYDIADTDGKGTSRLRRIAHLCERYGQRVQLSVFECRLSKTKFERLIVEISDIIDEKRDSVFLYQFYGRVEDAKIRLGKPEEHSLGAPWIL